MPGRRRTTSPTRWVPGNRTSPVSSRDTVPSPRSCSIDCWRQLTTAPSLALTARRRELVALGERRGIRNIRVFGSVARGSDHHHSDIDLLVDVVRRADPLGFAMFVAEATDLLGFPVEAVVDSPEIHPHLRRSAVLL